MIMTHDNGITFVLKLVNSGNHCGNLYLWCGGNNPKYAKFLSFFNVQIV